MAKAKLPETLTVKAKIYGRLYNPSDEEPSIMFLEGATDSATQSLEKDGYFFVRDVDFSILLPRDFDVHKAQLTVMRKGIESARAEMQNKLSAMVAEMQKFEALTWEGAEA